MHESIPNGLKNNVYFILDEKKNIERGTFGKASEYYDDCGAWDRNGKGTPTSYYRVKGEYVSLIKFNKAEVLYYTYKGQQLNPQPNPNEILIIKRYYLKLKANNGYERRITRILAAPPGLISNIQYAVVEYKGEFPGHRSHGLTTMTDSIYLRTPSSIMDNIGELSKINTPRTIYNTFSSSNNDNSINNLKQIRNKKHYLARKESEPTHVSNFADQFQYINQLAINEPMIKGVNLEPNYGVIVFNDYQLLDIERFCCSGMTPLGFDKTYNLGNIFLTGSAYKNLAVKSSKTGEVPIFLGPMYLHTKSTFSDFHPFFSCLASKLRDISANKLIISSDNERALVKAIEFNFHTANHFLCSRHLRQKFQNQISK